ncbi:M23 family metallopeptidase [Streptomyces sp. NPDC002851]
MTHDRLKAEERNDDRQYDDGPGSTRRAMLGIATAVLGAGALGFRGPTPGQPKDEEAPEDAWTGDCAGAFDAEYETLLTRSTLARELERDVGACALEDYGCVRGGAAGLAGAAPRMRWARPLARSYRVSNPYGVRGDWAAGHHTGIDLAVPRGTPVRVVGSGVVVLAARSGAYGKAVTIRMKDGYYAVYAHLSRIGVRYGARVHTGEYLGRAGSTGRATGPHLHLEIRRRRHYGSDVNPVRYLAKRGVRI